jgi:hypothetical protein
MSTLVKNYGPWQPAPQLTIATLGTDGLAGSESNLGHLQTIAGPARIIHLPAESGISLFTAQFFRETPKKSSAGDPVPFCLRDGKKLRIRDPELTPQIIFPRA